MSNYFSKNLKFLREKRNLSQNKLAEMIGVNQTTIARWEDDNRTPNLDNAIDVSRILNIPLHDLIGIDLRTNSINVPPNKEINEDYKKILKEKGLTDENITEEDAKKLIDFAIANKDFIIKKNE
jgi:transcriptional regulator with XRE-family HTH domain